MKKIFITVPFLLAISSIAGAKEVNGAYGKLALGIGHAANYNISHTDTVGTSGKTKARGHGFLGAGAVGYGVQGGLRGELEFLANDGVKGKRTIYGVKNYVKIKTTAFMLNGYYDFSNSTKATPYVMLGAGYGKVKTELNNSLGSSISNKNSHVMQLGLGVSYDIMPKTKFEFGYKYLMQGSNKRRLDQNIATSGGPVSFKIKRQAGEVHFGTVGLRMYL